MRRTSFTVNTPQPISVCCICACSSSFGASTSGNTNSRSLHPAVWQSHPASDLGQQSRHWHYGGRNASSYGVVAVFRSHRVPAPAPSAVDQMRPESCESGALAIPVSGRHPYRLQSAAPLACFPLKDRHLPRAFNLVLPRSNQPLMVLRTQVLHPKRVLHHRVAGHARRIAMRAEKLADCLECHLEFAQAERRVGPGFRRIYDSSSSANVISSSAKNFPVDCT